MCSRNVAASECPGRLLLQHVDGALPLIGISFFTLIPPTPLQHHHGSYPLKVNILKVTVHAAAPQCCLVR